VNVHRRWTQSDITDLRGRARLGGSLCDVADGLGRAPDDVVRMMGRLRLCLVGVQARPSVGTSLPA